MSWGLLVLELRLGSFANKRWNTMIKIGLSAKNRMGPSFQEPLDNVEVIVDDEVDNDDNEGNEVDTTLIEVDGATDVADVKIKSWN
ncbi:hypothetical protein H5410_027228 [Solanum commersonii]|uniref:Uncharacterized protein n=1 Tax=Solanum commersonii TaxID=4109 RepID=A0A9J5Z189_SOLCO|nr:hypothetical protein H5410_027228 [Solanum commersonii]